MDPANIILPNLTALPKMANVINTSLNNLMMKPSSMKITIHIIEEETLEHLSIVKEKKLTIVG